MLFEEKKSFFTELKESGHNIVWAVVIVAHLCGFGVSLEGVDRHGWDAYEVAKLWFLYGILFVLCCILDTLKRLLRNSSRGL